MPTRDAFCHEVLDDVKVLLREGILQCCSNMVVSARERSFALQAVTAARVNALAGGWLARTDLQHKQQRSQRQTTSQQLIQVHQA